jgi:predicted site-specific integrase-resolvase
MIRLTEWASQQGIAYITAFKWTKRGKVPGLHRAVSGRLFVEVPDPPAGRKVALYGRVSSSDQSEDLGRQMARLRDFASARGLVVSQEVSEVGSGLNGHRKRLVALLADPNVGVVVVEHRDRLARFGVDYIEAALRAQGRQVVVLNEGEQKLDIVQDFIDVVTSMCARIYGRRAASNRAKAALSAAAAVP